MVGFVTEDGAGHADANSYASVEDFRDFAQFRIGVTVPDDDLTIQKALVTATGWIDTNFASLFLGYQSTNGQALAWPRGGFTGPDGYDYGLQYVAPQVVKATCILACECLKGDPLYKNADGAARQIIDASVGPIIKKYNPVKPSEMTIERQFPEVRATLAPVTRFNSLRVSRGDSTVQDDIIGTPGESVGAGPEYIGNTPPSGWY